MNSDEELLILNYLKANEASFFSPAEISRRASPRLFAKDKKWAGEPLLRLFAARLIEADPSGHYRYVDLEQRKKDREAALKRQRDRW